ncbi:winged helix-turn-helix domain-containing protein [Hartmannibacter diazotrophicus]|uniref:winged helix-turn-helix domain-containing protein n=1 Tax=Hartmannibacter diazotrophicus TaxID=1482074 RepID=UPI000C14FAF9
MVSTVFIPLSIRSLQKADGRSRQRRRGVKIGCRSPPKRGQYSTPKHSKAHEQDTQYLRVFIRQLRQKLGDDPANPRYIMNEPGVGYRMLEPAT